ncbi:MAG TPA: caspase family protein [Usitatibacter sp.]|nr:caspase family protein [Usitatibacter sp.]
MRGGYQGWKLVAYLWGIAGVLACTLAAAASERVALLIGNNQYASTPLRNAANDARDLAETLKELGFKVIVRENASRKEMFDAIREFAQALEGANTALFFYAGHAMQFKDRNYLIPIDAAMGSEEDVTFFSVEVGQVFDRMDRARTRFNFIILDACRDNPFASSFKLTSAGLAQMSAPSGTLIAYATAPGSVAQDGFGRNGVYTKHILQNIKVPDLPAEIMFKRVREGVERDTRKLQTPWDSSSLKGDFVFAATRPAAGATTQAAGPSADMSLTIEREFWVSVRDSNRPEDIQAYLEKYPNGAFAPLARNRLDALVRPTRVASTEARSAAREPAAPAATATPKIEPAPTKPEAQPAQAAPPAAVAKSESAKPAPPPDKAAEAPVVVAAASPPSSAALPAPSAPSATVAPAVAMPKPPEQPGREVAPGVREIAFADGAIYRGGMRGSSYHGKGEYSSKSFKYEGEFQEGLKHGSGIYVWENGDRYEGTFAEDRADGQGKYRFANGDTYEGQVKGGVIVGRGTYVARNGDVFEGSFSGGKPHGVGVYRFASGDRYEGEMDQGRLQGKGRYFNKSGDRIEAPFADGKPQGKGIYHFANGDRYEGDINGGELTGVGAYFYASGLKYEGEMRAGQPEGRGVFWFQDGSRFEGVFQNGLARARGEIVRPDGTRSAAEIVDGNAKLLN